VAVKRDNDDAVTGEQGKVGALAALGLYDDVEEAVKAYDKK
jgi:hypothetical protein